MKVRQTLLALGAFAALGCTAASAEQQQLFAVLNGSFETPAHDPNFVGSAAVQLITSRQICYAVLVDNIDGPISMHIHKGNPGVAGPITIPLTPPAAGNPGKIAGCIGGLDAAVLADIFANPVRYYVNVHTGDFPGGAVRGQLFSVSLGTL